MEHPKPKQWELLSLVPLLAGLYWLVAQDGGAWLFWAFVPGSLLLATGVATLLFPGDPRINGVMALGGAAGVLLFLPAWIAGDFFSALLALAGSVASFLAAGRLGLVREPVRPGAEPPDIGLKMDAKTALDEALLGYFVIGAQVPSGDEARGMCEDAERMIEVFRARGWDRDAAGMHPAPPPPDKTWIESARSLGHDYERLRFDSGYVPDPALPGAELWNSYAANHRCEVRVLRHPGRPRPWLLCVHGYRMGMPWMDFGLFAPDWLHHRMGLNILQPVLPLHGPRRVGKRSGDYFLDGDPLDLVFAESQALWDLRRTLAWLRATEDNPRIGVFGISLGGYNTALLANYEGGLDFAVAGVPVLDFSTALLRFISPSHMEYFRSFGLDEQRYAEVLSVVSPLSRPPLIPRERRHIVAAAGDRVVLPDQPLLLAKHWDVPVTWYQGSHLTVRREREPRRVLREAVARAGWSTD